MEPLFLDTGYLIAIEAVDDQHHQLALEHWNTLVRSLPPLVTTSYVCSEVVTFFNVRNQHAKAVELGNRLVRSRAIRFIHVEEVLFHEGWDYLAGHADKSYSLTDCVSFVVMKRLGIRTALTVDRHFVQAGFERLP
jgi:uncharacterized protein